MDSKNEFIKKIADFSNSLNCTKVTPYSVIKIILFALEARENGIHSDDLI